MVFFSLFIFLREKKKLKRPYWQGYLYITAEHNLTRHDQESQIMAINNSSYRQCHSEVYKIKNKNYHEFIHIC